ncbi:MAG: hypothetical protein EOM73_02620 [Bacteroidia bacterium]|nr:hypothetical protein [Bacteroidia bacterium]
MEKHLVTILRITTPQLGSFVKNCLEAEGIECFFTNEGTTIGSDYNPDEVLLKVQSRDSEKAVKILLRVHKEYDLDKIHDDPSFAGLKKILVPVKLGPECVPVCRYAFSLAQKINAEIKLLYVYPDPTIDESYKHTVSWEKHVKLELKEAHNQALKELSDFSSELKKQIPENLLKTVKIHYRMLKGVPEYVIADAAVRYSPDFILMGMKGNQEPGEFPESTVSKLVGSVGFPIWVVPATVSAEVKDKFNVLYATDFAEHDNASLKRIMEVFHSSEVKIFCVHIDTGEDENIQAKAKKLDDLLKNEFGNLNIQFSLVENDEVAKGIRSFAAQNGIDLISLSKMKRSSFYKMFHHNLLGKIVLAQNVPMLIIPV